MMQIEVKAIGGEASGKTFILKQIQRLLHANGFECDDPVNTAIEEEYIIAERDDAIRLVGDRRIQIGDWEIEVDSRDMLVDVYFKGNNIRATAVTANFAMGSLTEIVPEARVVG